MAPSRERQPRAEPAASESEEELESNSPEVRQLESVQRVITQVNNRRDKKRNALIREYEEYGQGTRTRIKKTAMMRKTKVDQAHTNLWNRLDTLNTRREKVEQAILKSMRTIEMANKNMSQQIDAMYKGRIEDLEEIVFDDNPE